MHPKVPPSAPDYKKLSDEELIYRYVHRHDNGCIPSLFDKYGHLVMGICCTYTPHADGAKKLTEAIFIELLSDLKKYDIELFKPWLYQYVHTYCKKNTIGVIEVSKLHESNVFDTATDVDSDARVEAMETLVKKLNKEQRTCMELFYQQGLTHAEIAKKTAWPQERVKQLIQEGKHNLKIKLEASQHVNQ